MAFECFLGAGVAGVLGWFGSNVWQKHGPRVAERFPIVEKVGLAESPVDVKRRDANASVKSGNVSNRDGDK